MSGIYHKMFVNYSFDTPEKIDLLNKYMYVKAKPIIVSDTKAFAVEPKPVVQSEKNDIYYPEKKDMLFWCLYIAKNGMQSYNTISHGYSNIEMEEKHKIMEFIKSQPNRLKNTNVKITNIAAQEIMSDIVTNVSLSISTLVAMSVFYNARIILTKNNKFYINICPIEEYENTFIFHKNSNGDYGVDICTTELKIQQIEANQLCLHRFDKPLDAISNFSVEELKKLSIKLGVDHSIKYKKNELYQEATRRCLW